MNADFKIRFLHTLFFFLLLFSFSTKKTIAHSGRTDSSGGHNCNVGSCAGTYHYHNGGYTPPSTWVVPTPIFPISTNAIWSWSPNLNKTYDVEVKLDDANPTQYSAVFSKCKGCDPGPLVDFSTNKFKFENVSPGVWYMNVKKEVSGRWSNIVYWKIEVPDWVSPTPTPTPSIVAKNTSTSSSPTSSDNSDFILTIVILFLVCSMYFGYKLINWFLIYAKNNDWVYTILIWIAIFGCIFVYSLFANHEDNSKYGNSKKSNYVCNCSKTCPNLSCAEAYFQLNDCGCSVRDGDGDGVPCEAQCR